VELALVSRSVTPGTSHRDDPWAPAPRAAHPREPKHAASTDQLPLNEVFRALADDLHGTRLGRTSRMLADELDRGVDLSTAIKAVGDGRFGGSLYRALAASVETGQTAAVLEGFAAHRAANKRIRRQVRSALLYPIVVLTLLGAVLMGLMFVVVPEFGAMFRELDLALPEMTVFVLESSQSVPWAILAAFCVIPAYLALSVRPGGRRLAHWLRTGTPILGRIWMWTAQHEFASIFGSLTARRVPLDDALQCTAEALNDRNLARATRIVARKCEMGVPLSQAMAESIHFDRSLTGLAAWGEAYDALPEAMRQAVSAFEKEIELHVLLLRRAMPPLLFIAVATLVFTFVIMLIIPLVDLTNNLM
jgi:type IV pilus assembly protein PilC